ncbi:DNA-binding protein [Blastococcus sp. TF02A-35]|nr:DNA-binding protein [Blastococcus sp. TF02A_35]
MAELEDLLSTAEFAQKAKVPAGTVRHWRDVGTGPAYLRIGRHVRYRPSDVMAWLEGQRVSTGDAA